MALLRLSDGLLLKDLCVTDVPMRDYSDEEINAYVQTGDPLDKAGAYAIQHPRFRPGCRYERMLCQRNGIADVSCRAYDAENGISSQTPMFLQVVKLFWNINALFLSPILRGAM